MGNTHKNSRKVQNKTMGLGIALSLIFLIGCNYYDVATSPESGAELAVGTRETIILSVETDEDMEPEDEPEIQIEHIDISPEGIVSARILSDYTIGIDVLAAGEAHLTIRTNLELIEMDVVAVVPDAVRFVPWHWNPDHGGPAEAWLLDGRQDGAFVWSARGKDLHGAAVGELEISPASALLIQRYVDGRFWGD
ncbi:MAG: hypothetical protein GY847_16965, partial [Proteobacteria bacterium]|nr:hypothetical protein [Pseudomonadota bacterium]